MLIDILLDIETIQQRVVIKVFISMWFANCVVRTFLYGLYRGSGQGVQYEGHSMGARSSAGHGTSS